MNVPHRIMAALGGLVVCASTFAACGRDVAAPSTRVSASAVSSLLDRTGVKEPNFLEPAPGAPAIANPVIAFTATQGRDTTVRMYYRPRRNSGDSAVFAEFRVPAKALAFHPDGRAIRAGESVQITMTLVDPEHGIIDFEPSGLRFSGKTPARLKISYENANLDLNHDGVVDARDQLLIHLIHIVCRERPDGPWTPVLSANDTELDEVEAPIRGFSGYALDY